MISKQAALVACQNVIDTAKSCNIPQMAMGAIACRDAILALKELLK